MSSTFLTTANLTEIETILSGVRPSLVHGSGRHTAAARFLIDRFNGKSDGHSVVLAAYIEALDSREDALSRWNDDGGAIGKAPRTEARRRIDNDTNGMRRRDQETADRHRLM